MTADTESPARSELIGSVRPDPCSCIEKMNERLAQLGYALELGSIVRMEKDGTPGEDLGMAPILKTERLNSKPRGRSPRVWAKFCPFCGQRLWPEREA